MNNTNTHGWRPEKLRKLLTQKWPEATASGLADSIFHTRIAHLDALFPKGGIPYGQLIEITGNTASGKTSLLFKILASLTRIGTVAYIDPGNSFFPPAAVSGGVDTARLWIVTPKNLQSGLRAAELLLAHRMAHSIALDLVGQKGDLSPTLLHRLRQQAARAKALIIFLTEKNNGTSLSKVSLNGIIPASIVSLRLEVRRQELSRIEVTVTKSRISKEGVKAQLELNE